MKIENRSPISNSNNIIEKELGRWVCSQIKNYKNIKEALKDIEKRQIWTELTQKYKEYFKSNDEIWYDTYNQLIDYIEINDKKPSSESKDLEQKKLGLWISTQTQNYKKIQQAMKDLVKRQKFENLVKQYPELFPNFEFIELTPPSPPSTSSSASLSYISSTIPSIPPPISSPELSSMDTSILNTKTVPQLKEICKEYKLKVSGKKDELIHRITDHLSKHDNKIVNIVSDSKEVASISSLPIDNAVVKKKILRIKPKTSSYINTEQPNINTITETEPKVVLQNTPIQCNTPVHEPIIVNSSEIIDLNEEINKPSPKKKIIIKKSTHTTPTAISNNNPISTDVKKITRERVKSQLSILHQKYKTLNSTNLHKLFKEQPTLWKEYHEIADKNEQLFEEQDMVPFRQIITYLSKVKTRRSLQVADLGCGTARVSQYFNNIPDNKYVFYNYDHIAVNDNVVQCDIQNTPLNDFEIDYAILCLAMWGSNCENYLKEANRILIDNGILLLIEPAKRWFDDKDIIEQSSNGENRLTNLLNKNGFSIKRILSNNKFIFYEAFKKND
jgi:ribosomal RNA-processing protein 8